MQKTTTMTLLAAVVTMGCTRAPSPSAPAPALAMAPVRAQPSAQGTASVAQPPTRDASESGQRSELLKAKASFAAFIARADGKAEYVAAVDRAKQRIEDIDRILIFLDGAPAPAPTAP